MITLRNIKRAHRQRQVLNGITAKFEAGQRVGILGAAGSGKSTLIRIIAGAELPDTGQVGRTSRVSWPLGLAAAFHPDLSGLENIAHLARINHLDVEFTVAFCSDFAAPPKHTVLRHYTPAMRARLGFAFSLSAPFDFYLADEATGTGDDAFRARCDAMLNTRLASAGLILTTRRAASLRRYCTEFFALANGVLIPCPDADMAEAVVEAAKHTTREALHV